MPNSGNKFNDLYELSKIMKNQKKKEDKSTEQYEFEKHKSHLTFKPTINTRSAVKPSDRKSPVIDDGVRQVRGMEKSVERIRKGR
jgi:hypothetical protein